MELEIEIMSNEMIKPSIPTADHLKNLKLCLFDQFYQFTYVPHILFYKPPSIHINGCRNQMTAISRLKESLSDSLSLYYPFAGRFTTDESAIECNDNGVSFVVARALDCSIKSFLDATNRVDLVGHFLSRAIYDNNIVGNNNNSGGENDTNMNNDGNGDDVEASPPSNVTNLVPLTIQVTTFDCGGIVIGCQYLHKVCDGAAWGNFLKTWCSIATGRNKDIVIPDFETAVSLFHPRKETEQPGRRKVRRLVPLGDDDAAQLADGLCIVKAFEFSSHVINALQAQGTSDNVPHPTRIEAVSGFIWKHAMSAAVAARASSSLSSALSGPSAITHAVNMRPRFDPPLPSSIFGNLIIDTSAYYQGNNPDGEIGPNLRELVSLIRESLSKAKDSEFVNKFKGDDGGDVLLSYKHNLSELLANSNVITYKFTSWGGLGTNPDFGFGAPIWTGFTGGRLSSSFKNLVILMETCSGGIEAWMILDEQEMIILHSDEDFLEFALPSAGRLF